MQHGQPIRPAKVMFRVVSSRGDEAGSLVRQLMGGRVRPGNGTDWDASKVNDLRQSRRLEIA